MDGYHKANFAIPLKGITLFTADCSLRTLYSPLGHSKLHVVQEFETLYKINAPLCQLCLNAATFILRCGYLNSYAWHVLKREYNLNRKRENHKV